MNLPLPLEKGTAIESLLEELQPKLRAILSRFRIPAADAEDVVQQGLLALVYQWDEIHDPETWLTGTLRHKCLRYWRERKRRLYEAVDATCLDWVADGGHRAQEHLELRCDLETMIGRLSPRCREMLRLRYSLGYDAPEVSERTGYRPSSVNKVTSRCLEALYGEMLASGYSRRRPAGRSEG